MHSQSRFTFAGHFLIKQTTILHMQEALIVGSITHRTETVKVCNHLYKKTIKIINTK